MEEWKEYKLKEVTSVLGDGIHGTPKYDDKGSIFFINGNNLENGRIVIKDTTKRVSEREAEKYKKPLCDRTLMVSINGTLGNVARYNGEPCILGKSACFFNVKEDFEKDFIYYVVNNQYFRNEIERLATGTTIKNVSLETMRNYSFLVPSLDIQRRIASILSSLDDKIELNRKINANLEAQAQALFKSWFVDFEPFKDQPFVESELGMIPEGWRVYCLSEFLPVITGKKDANVAKGGPYPFFSCSQDFGWTDDYSFEGNAILVAGNGDFNVKMYNGKFEAYQRTYVLIPHNPQYTAWLFYAVKYHLNDITSAARGSVIKFITKGNLADFKFPAPQGLDKAEIIEKFDCFRRIIASNEQESRRLASLRDTLLPRLMSGELKVNEVI